MAYTSGQQRAISHRDWSRKKAPISRVGSYDFNGTVDRATMKMHMAAADRPMSTHAKVLTLWPLSSTAIDKTECFAVREREVLWTMRAGKGMGRTTDGRMKALSSLNYFRLVLEDWQLEQLKGIISNAVKGTFTGLKTDNDTAMRILTALVGDNRMNDTVAQKIKIDDLNKIDRHLRHYVLANIQYAGIVITGEEPGSRQSLQGIAVTVGGLNTLANNGDKTLCPGMKLCMTVPRCVPDSTEWPAPCDHIGLPHGKVTPILRQAEAQDLTQTILGGTHHIHTQVARMMSGCGGYASADKMTECKPARDVYFAFVHDNFDGSINNARKPELIADALTYSNASDEILNDEMDVMRCINDAVVLTMQENISNFGVAPAQNIRFERERATTYDPRVQGDITGLAFGSSPKDQVLPLVGNISAMGRLMIVAFGNVRDVVHATFTSKNANSDQTARYFDVGGSPIATSLDPLVKDGIEYVLQTKLKNVPNCLKIAGDVDGNKMDPDGKHYAAMMVDVMQQVQDTLKTNKVTLVRRIPGGGNVLQTIQPNKVEYHKMQAVSNGNAAFALGKQFYARSDKDPAANSADELYQPNVIVLDDNTSLPWENEHIVTLCGKIRPNYHTNQAIVFRKTFHAPLRKEAGSDSTHIELSDNELPFVGAWFATYKGNEPDDSADPYRSNFAPERFLVHEEDNVKYYYLTWSAVVHLVCNNVLHQHENGRKILEMRRAELVTSPHYAFDTDYMKPTLADPANRKFGAPGLGSYLQAILKPDTNDTTKYQDYLRKHSPIASLVNSVIRATVEAVTQHQLATDKKTVGMALSSAGRGEAVDVVLTGAV